MKRCRNFDNLSTLATDSPFVVPIQKRRDLRLASLTISNYDYEVDIPPIPSALRNRAIFTGAVCELLDPVLKVVDESFSALQLCPTARKPQKSPQSSKISSSIHSPKFVHRFRMLEPNY